VNAQLSVGWEELTIPEILHCEGIFCDGDWVEKKDQDPEGDVRLVQLADIGAGRWMNKSNRFLTRFAPDDRFVYAEFANCVLNSSTTRRRCTSAIRGVGRPRLNLGRIRQIAMPVPPLAEQEVILATVDRLFTAGNRSNTSVETSGIRAELLRQGILSEAFAGRFAGRFS